MADGSCPHCGGSHPASVCPTTGQPLPAAGGTVPDGKSVFTLLREAYLLYRLHARMLLMTCAFLFIPASVAHSCAMSAILGPTVSAAIYAEQTEALGARATEASREVYRQRFKDGKLDPEAVKAFGQQNERSLQDLAHQGATASGALLGDVALFFLRVLGTLVSAFFFGLVVFLTQGALTIAAADRILGGNTVWPQVWVLLSRRMTALLPALLPGALLIAFGSLLFVVPGFVVAVLFAFAAPAVVIEGLGGIDALKRSRALVQGDWWRVAVVVGTFVLLRWLAQTVAGLFIPRTALFLETLFGDLFTLVLMPIPVIGSVLLYLDVRRTHDGFTQDRLRADLADLKPGRVTSPPVAGA